MIYGYIFITLLIGITIGILIMHYKNQNALNNQKILHNELKTSKIKLNTYQQELTNHFTGSINLLKKIVKDQQELYHNITKNANFFLPNLNFQNTYIPNKKNNNKDLEQLSTDTKAPKDYSDNIKNAEKKI